MKIGINTFGCDHGCSGIGSYILSLVHNMPATEHKIQLFGHELDKYTYTSGIERVTYQGISITDSEFSEAKWHTFSFNTFAKKQKYDIVLFPAGLRHLPLSFDIPAVLVIQTTLNEASNSCINALAAAFTRRILKSIKGIICPSEYIKTALLKIGIDEEKLRVIHNGIDTALFYPRDLQNKEALLVQPFAIRRPYIIYASRIVYPEKCHTELIEAFELFKKRTHAPHRLVIAGADGKRAEIVHQAILRSSVASDIVLTGYFPHQNLPQLYSAADVCIFPSTIEGVGLPVMEAMACGIPTACAHAGALPEIAGNCSQYFNPRNPKEIASAIEQLIFDSDGKNTERRSLLIKNGMKHIQQYSWKETAEKTLSYLYEVGKI